MPLTCRFTVGLMGQLSNPHTVDRIRRLRSMVTGSSVRRTSPGTEMWWDADAAIVLSAH